MELRPWVCLAVVHWVMFVRLYTTSCLLGCLDAPAVSALPPQGLLLHCEVTAAGQCIHQLMTSEAQGYVS